MEFKEIKELITLLDASNISEFKLEEKDFCITLKKENSVIQSVTKINDNNIMSKEVEEEEGDKIKEDEDIHIIASPILGTFYSSPSPNSPSYVTKGSLIKKGDVLCIIEAMKMMNEITSDVDGEILEVFLNNQSPVEYNEPLFKVRKV